MRNFVVGTSLFLLRNSNVVIGTTLLLRRCLELALRAASEMPPVKLGEKI